MLNTYDMIKTKTTLTTHAMLPLLHMIRYKLLYHQLHTVLYNLIIYHVHRLSSLTKLLLVTKPLLVVVMRYLSDRISRDTFAIE